MANNPKKNNTILTDYDIHLFKEGSHFKLYEKLGSHIKEKNMDQIVFFAVWAPNAAIVSVIGDFNGWNPKSHPLEMKHPNSGIWEGYIKEAHRGAKYKYHIVSRYNNYTIDKGDPFAFHCQVSPETASIVWDMCYEWEDRTWMKKRKKHNNLKAPISIYEIHLGSWRPNPKKDERFLNYRELACELASYVKAMGFTHVEFLPVMEHPFYGSWGYQMTGFFAPTSRYGTPQDFMYLIDYLHQRDIGVILDWVPSHFPTDGYGLAYFDGTHLYEHKDPRQGFHPDWKSSIFNYGRHEVRNFLISSALFWLEKYHIDGLRIDAVASMIYLDYSRKTGEWIPNKYGGKENLEALSFIKQLNETVYKEHPDVQTIAEESTAWPMISKPTYVGGLGFGMKWNMGWMHDTLKYFSRDSIYRKHHHNELTFSAVYAFSENFVLSLSHDEVVHGKRSLIAKMPGNDWQKSANLRLLLGYMYGHPGKKLLFMGGEFGHWKEWNHDSFLDWQHLESPFHQSIQQWVRDLNRFYGNEPILYEHDFEPESFEWADFQDWEKSIISFIRKGNSPDEAVLVVCNLTPVLRHDYRVSVPSAGIWKEVLNSDAKEYGGSGQGNFGEVKTESVPAHGKKHSLKLSLPPLGVLFFKLNVPISSCR